MHIGEAIPQEVIERWEKRSLIAVVPLSSRARHVRAVEVANVRPGVFTGLAPIREDDTAVRVKGARSIS